MKAKHNLEHIIFNSWKKNPNVDSFGTIIVAVSGGGDSMALLQGLLNCFPKERLVIVHCHHGSGKNKKFRDQAQHLVETFCRERGLICHVKTATEKLESEAEFREFRLQSFQAVSLLYASVVICLAHHRDDWLENQLIKLIRGSSLISLRKSFQWSRISSRNLLLWRPFYNCSQSDLKEYSRCGHVPFVEDPSNHDLSYFRNWLRLAWLPQLESVRPGSVKRLGLSLLNSVSEIQTKGEAFPWDFATSSIDRIYFISLSEVEKMRCLAYFVREKELKDVKSSQLKEIVRQLDKNKDRYHIHFKTFECVVNAERVVINVP